MDVVVAVFICLDSWVFLVVFLDFCCTGYFGMKEFLR